MKNIKTEQKKMTRRNSELENPQKSRKSTRNNVHNHKMPFFRKPTQISQNK